MRGVQPLPSGASSVEAKEEDVVSRVTMGRWL
jgi:hypothetical protein